MLVLGLFLSFVVSCADFFPLKSNRNTDTSKINKIHFLVLTEADMFESAVQ